MAERTLVANLLVSSLAPESDLEVFQLTQLDSSMVSQASRENGSVLILVEEGKSKDTFFCRENRSEAAG
jgi:hypothetical protein